MKERDVIYIWEIPIRFVKYKFYYYRKMIAFKLLPIFWKFGLFIPNVK